MIKKTVTMHMLGSCKTVKELSYIKDNYFAFVNNESKEYSRIITIEACCDEAEMHIKKECEGVTINCCKGNTGIAGAILLTLKNVSTDYYVTIHNDALIKKAFIDEAIKKFGNNTVTVAGTNPHGEGVDSWCMVHDTEKLKQSIKNIPTEYVNRVCGENYTEEIPWFYSKFLTIQNAIIKTFGQDSIVADKNINEAVEHQWLKRYLRGSAVND